MRHVEAHGAAKHLDGGFQQHHGGGAVHVVVAVEQDGLASRDGALHALDGRVHSQHQHGIVQMRDVGIEERDAPLARR